MECTLEGTSTAILSQPADLITFPRLPPTMADGFEPLKEVEKLLPDVLAEEHSLEQADAPLLGVGAFAKIFKVREKFTGEFFAMKVMERNFFAAQGLEAQLMSEITAMKTCMDEGRCQHVVELWAARELNGSVYLLMELCETNLLNHLSSMPGNSAPEALVLTWARQLFMGLRDLHHLGIIHRDIKLENLLLAGDGNLKIADFGWCAELSEHPASLAGSWEIMAPEVLSQIHYTTAVDVWSAGCSLMHALLGQPLLARALGLGSTGLSATDAWRATRAKIARFLCEIGEVCPPTESRRPEHASKTCWSFLARVLTPEPAKRTSAREALSHDWLRCTPRVDKNLFFVPMVMPKSLVQEFEIECGPLGRGTFSQIFCVRDKSGEFSCMKVLDRDLHASKGVEHQISEEFNALRRCVEEGRSNHVTKLIDAREEDGYVFLRMEFCQTNLLDHLGQLGGCAPEESVAAWAEELFMGLSDIHHLGIIHRDIKLKNLLLASDGRLKIAEFGWCVDGCQRTANLGTLSITAPEILERAELSPAVDVWSAGCALMHALIGRPLLTEATTLSFEVSSAADPSKAAKDRFGVVLAEIDEVCSALEDLRPDNVSVCCWEFLLRSLSRRAEDRLTVEEALEHKWFASTLRAIDQLLPASLTDTFEACDEPLVGVGAFAKVFKVKEIATGLKFAMKVLDREIYIQRGLEHLIAMEFGALQLCTERGRCQRITRLWDAREENGCVYLRMDLCDTSLLLHMSTFPCGVVPESTASFWSAQLFSGLADLHALGLVHRDIKPENLLLASDGSLKIADFGWCANLEEEPTCLAGTFQTMAPEMLEGRVQTAAVDVWSAAATIFHLVMGGPFLTRALSSPTGLSETNPHDAALEMASRLLDEITESSPPLDETRPEHLSPCLWDFLQRTLVPEPRNRILAHRALDHEWLQDVPLAGDPEVTESAPKYLPGSLLNELEQPDGPLLGAGAFSMIFKVREKSSGQFFAMKAMQRNFFIDQGLERQITNEFDALRRCVEENRCRHVIQLWDAREEKGIIYFRMELCTTNLFLHMQRFPDCCAPERLVGRLTIQLFKGLQDIHAMNIMHRDVKLENLLLTQDGCLKIADFGWCANIGDGCTGLAGTFQCMAPEVLEQELHHTVSTDVWSAGCSIAQMLLGRPLLWKALSISSTGLSVTDPRGKTDLIVERLLQEISGLCPLADAHRPEHISELCWNLLREALQPVPDKRISAVDALRHEWLRKVDRFEFVKPVLLPLIERDAFTAAADKHTLEGAQWENPDLREPPHPMVLRHHPENQLHKQPSQQHPQLPLQYSQPELPVKQEMWQAAHGRCRAKRDAEVKTLGREPQHFSSIRDAEFGLDMRQASRTDIRSEWVASYAESGKSTCLPSEPGSRCDISPSRYTGSVSPTRWGEVSSATKWSDVSPNGARQHGSSGWSPVWPFLMSPAGRTASAVRSASVANRSGSTVRRSGSAVRRCGSATRSTSTTRLSNTPRNSTTSQVKTQCAGAGQTPSRMIMMSPSPRAMAAQPLGLGAALRTTTTTVLASGPRTHRGMARSRSTTPSRPLGASRRSLTPRMSVLQNPPPQRPRPRSPVVAPAQVRESSQKAREAPARAQQNAALFQQQMLRSGRVPAHGARRPTPTTTTTVKGKHVSSTRGLLRDHRVQAPANLRDARAWKALSGCQDLRDVEDTQSAFAGVLQDMHTASARFPRLSGRGTF